MVSEWFPEPPQDSEGSLSAPSQIVLVDDEGSDDELHGFAPAGYELLSQSLNGLSSDEEDNSEDEAAAATSEPSHSIEPPQQSADMQARTQSEIQEVAELYSGPTRTDININCDEVRAAMAGFNLPPSAIPSWALNIPESQWTSTLNQQIQRIQSTSSPRDS